MKKYNFEIEIMDSEQIAGGYIYTSAPRTEKQVAKELEKLGRENIKYNKGMKEITYSAYAWDENEDIVASVTVIVKRSGRGCRVHTVGL